MRNLTFSSDSLSTKRRVIVEIKERLSLSVTRQSFTSGRDERKRHDDVDASLPIKSVGNKWNDDHWKSRKLLWASYSIGKDFWLWTSFYSTTSFFFFFFFYLIRRKIFLGSWWSFIPRSLLSEISIWKAGSSKGFVENFSIIHLLFWHETLIIWFDNKIENDAIFLPFLMHCKMRSKTYKYIHTEVKM